jgi:MinD-like ATPase involved in chromosome partitioning or flagellar assembly
MPAPPSQRDHAGAKTIAFSGAAGSPGKTTLCINVAYELAAAGKRVAVVDFDLSSPSLLTALNQDSITAGLAGVRRLAFQGRFLSDDLSRFLMVLNFDGVRLAVLPGLAKTLNSPSNDISWRQVADELLALLRQDFDYVVIDLPDLAAEPSLVVHLLNSVDYGFAVSAADPVSVERWLWFKTQLDSLGVIETPVLVVNQVRDSVLGSNARAQLADTFERVAKTEVACFIAQDSTGFDLAMREGLPLQLAKKASPARHSISMLVRQGILNQRSRLDWRVARLG